jgi:hypothetical protein
MLPRISKQVGLWAADVQPLLPAQSHGTHGILREVIAQLKFGILQELRRFIPEHEHVMAGLAEYAGGQSTRLRCLDLAADIIEKRSRCFLTPGMARRNSQRFAASFSIDGK